MFKSLPLFFLYLFTVILSVSACYAASPMVIDINDGIEEIPFETGDVDKEVTSSFVQVIDISKLPETTLDITQVIRNRSGIQIRQAGGVGSFSTISIRGKSADQVTVYLDGIPLNNVSGGSVDLGLIPINQIARIEIYKDSIPVEFSETANGGVINIITHRATLINQSKISASYGSFKTQQYNFSTIANINKWQYVLAGGYFESKNNFRYNDDNGTATNPDDDEIQPRYNNQLYQTNILGKAKYTIDNHRSIQYQSELFKKLKNIPSVYNRFNDSASLTYNVKNINLGYSDKEFYNEKLALNFNLRINNKSTLFDDRLKSIRLEPTYIDQINQTTSANIYLKYSNHKFLFTYNTSLRYEQMSVNDLLDSSKSITNNRKTASSALGADIYFLNKRLVISPVFRHFISKDRFQGDTQTNTGLEKDTNFGKQYQTIMPQLGLRYTINSDWNFKLNIAKYYRVPNYLELFGNRGYIGSSEELLPEEGVNFDAGFELLRYINSEKLTKIDWNFAAFHSRISNEIVYVLNARSIGKPFNNSQSTITGLENNVILEFNYNAELIINTTLQLPLNTSNPSNTDVLIGRSFWFQTTRLQTHNNNLNFHIEHVWQSPYYYDTIENASSKEKSIFNSGLGINRKQFNINLAINNIFDKLYKDYFLQASPGMSVIMSVEFRIQ